MNNKCYKEIKHLLMLNHKELNLGQRVDSTGSISPLTFFSFNRHFDFIIISAENTVLHKYIVQNGKGMSGAI